MKQKGRWTRQDRKIIIVGWTTNWTKWWRKKTALSWISEVAAAAWFLGKTAAWYSGRQLVTASCIGFSDTESASAAKKSEFSTNHDTLFFKFRARTQRRVKWDDSSPAWCILFFIGRMLNTFFKSTFSLFQQIFSSLAASFLSSHAKNEKEQKTGPFKFKFCQHENRLKRSESGFCRRRHSPDFHFEMTFFFWWQEQQQRPK